MNGEQELARQGDRTQRISRRRLLIKHSRRQRPRGPDSANESNGASIQWHSDARVRRYRKSTDRGASMTRTTRRVGAETSKTRDAILNCVEKLMVREGYPGVTYRLLAAEAGVTPSLVQYYFPTLDGIFIAALQRRTTENVQRLREALAERPDEILHVMWEFSRKEATGALVTEFMALGNHRQSVGVEIAKVTEQIRQIQLDAIRSREEQLQTSDTSLTAGALITLIAGIPKMLSLEKGIGITAAHDDVMAAFESYIDSVEPPRPTKSPRKRKPRARTS